MRNTSIVEHIADIALVVVSSVLIVSILSGDPISLLPFLLRIVFICPLVAVFLGSAKNLIDGISNEKD